MFVWSRLLFYRCFTEYHQFKTLSIKPVGLNQPCFTCILNISFAKHENTEMETNTIKKAFSSLHCQSNKAIFNLFCNCHYMKLKWKHRYKHRYKTYCWPFLLFTKLLVLVHVYLYSFNIWTYDMACSHFEMSC